MCYNLVMNKSTNKYASYGNLKHGLKGTPLYCRWKGIRARCNNKNHRWYKNYGGKGVKISEEWNDFKIFHLDMYDSFLEHVKKHGIANTSIDRIDNNKNYSKENCKWSTRLEQGANRSNVILYDYLGENNSLAEWSRKLGIRYGTLYLRASRGKKGKELFK